MTLWKNIKGIWNPKARGEAIVDTQVSCFNQNKKRYPDRDPNAWLALTLQGRLNWRGRPELVYYTMTAQFSVLEGKNAPLAFGFYPLEAENTGLGIFWDVSGLMAPIQELFQNGQMLSTWRRINPWIAEHFPSVETGIAGALEDPQIRS